MEAGARTESIDARQRVLMFAHYFPPIGGSGVYRTIKHVKYLPSAGFDSIVVAGAARGAMLRDATLTRDVPAGTIVIRARAFPVRHATVTAQSLLRHAGLPSRALGQLLWPDGMVGWLPGAVLQGLRAVRAHRPAVLYSSCAPMTGHVAALIVHRLTGLPWVADFRDPWALWRFGAVAASYGWLRRATEELERTVVREASRTVVASEHVELVGVAADHPRRVVITNGVDPDDFPPNAAPALQRDRFRLSYVGTLFGGLDCSSVFTAARSLISAGKLDPGEFEVRLVGRPYDLGAAADSLPITAAGYLSHDRAIAEMRAASVLLLYQPEEILFPSGKTFEYLCSGRPVLCVSHPESSPYRLIRELGAGECADVRDPSLVADALERLVVKWRRGALSVDRAVREVALRRFSRRKLAADLAAVFRSAILEQRSVTAPAAAHVVALPRNEACII